MTANHSPNYTERSMTIPAQGVFELVRNASFITCLQGSNKFKLRLNEGTESTFEAGLTFKPEGGLYRVTIRNPTNEDLSLSIGLGVGDIIDSRLTLNSGATLTVADERGQGFKDPWKDLTGFHVQTYTGFKMLCTKDDNVNGIDLAYCRLLQANDGEELGSMHLIYGYYNESYQLSVFGNGFGPRFAELERVRIPPGIELKLDTFGSAPADFSNAQFRAQIAFKVL